MKSSFKSILFLIIFAALGLAKLSPGWAQQSDMSFDFEAAKVVASEGQITNGANSLPFEDSPSFDGADISVVDPTTALTKTETDFDACQTCEGTVVTDQELFPEVKNVNFFGVDRETCCDEWSGFCKMKSLKFGCSCGGLKANKGHLGLRCLKGRNGGEGCDFCNGGCCEEGDCDQGCRDKCSLKGCLSKCFLKCCKGKESKSKSCGCQNKSTPRFVFGRPVENSCQECCCDKSCPPEEGCESCK